MFVSTCSKTWATFCLMRPAPASYTFHLPRWVPSQQHWRGLVFSRMRQPTYQVSHFEQTLVVFCKWPQYSPHLSLRQQNLHVTLTACDMVPGTYFLWARTYFKDKKVIHAAFKPASPINTKVSNSLSKQYSHSLPIQFANVGLGKLKNQKAFLTVK